MTSKSPPRVASSSADELGESPCWIADEARLYWVDLRRRLLHRLGADGMLESFLMPEPIAGVVARRGGGVVVTLKTGLHAFDPNGGSLSLLVAVEDGPPEHRLNDTKCDPAGRIFVGSMWDYGLESTGRLYRVDGDLSVTTLRTGVAVPNAIAFSPDHRTIYFADTRMGAIERADLDLATGAVGPWSILVPRDGAPGRPDGATVDSEGFLWNARYGGGCIARFAPDGRLDRLVPLPVTQPTSCAFGGTDLATLYVTSARQRLSAEELAAQPLAGHLFALEPGVTGLPEPAFGG